MPAITLDAGDLLEYNAQHQLLICRKCRYAIQKNALESHLLRHKIYRGERQHLLASIARLDLLDPEHVPLPAPGSPPIDILPVLAGFRCSAIGCHHLTASSKRMKRHWSEAHDSDGTAPPLSSAAHPVELQTFFRGTKVRYFEVVSPKDTAINYGNATGTEGCGGDHRETSPDVRHADTGTRLLPILPTPAPSHVPRPLEISSESPVLNLSLDILAYFHHFLTEVALTLPGIPDRECSRDYWQRYVVAQALQRRWLMCGLMALSAHHLTILSDDRSVSQQHIAMTAQFGAEFFSGLNQMQRYVGYAETADMTEEDQTIGLQITNLLHCARWASDGSAPEVESLESSKLLLHIFAIRDCFIPCVEHYHARLGGNDYGLDNDLSAPGFLQNRNSSQRNLHVSSSADNTPSELLNRLRALPYRFAERLGKPDNSQDVFTTLSAITTMVECCETSFASNEPGQAWQGLVTWLAQVPAHFNRSLEQHQPASLVLLAYWAAILVKRAERTGCWFLKNSAKNIVLYVTQHLTVHARHVLDLVEGLKDLVHD